MGGYSVTARRGPKVERSRFEDLTSALDAIEQQGRALENGADAPALGGDLFRRFTPVQRVVARLELSGPARLQAGIDVRGDGSSEAWTGRVRRRVVHQRAEESAYDALRRAVA